ncbi:RNA exonuclease 1 [Nymphon striatum]|nr:RNA exonuclease 1 [Nymphon striatum]
MSISSPVGHGWEDKDTSIMPIMCLKSPAPQALLELIKCGCKGKCDKRQCSCLRNNVHCTPACLCGDGHNQDDAEKSADDGIGDESSSDETGDEEFLFNKLLRKCSRCQKKYSVNEYGNYVVKEPCVHHWGNFCKQQSSDYFETYYCCEGDEDSRGCTVAKGHVDNRINVDELYGFVQTADKNTPEKKIKTYAIDCEMCTTVSGLELTYVTVVNKNLEVVYETFVKPHRPIIDYNTRFSGITKKDLKGVHTTLEDVQNDLLELFCSKTILIGHSLNCDLVALKIIHNVVVDTSVIFPNARGLPFKRSLKQIVAKHLKKDIQTDGDGHDSYEDAKACFELILIKVKKRLIKNASKNK